MIEENFNGDYFYYGVDAIRLFKLQNYNISLNLNIKHDVNSVPILCGMWFLLKNFIR